MIRFLSDHERMVWRTVAFQVLKMEQEHTRGVPGHMSVVAAGELADRVVYAERVRIDVTEDREEAQTCGRPMLVVPDAAAWESEREEYERRCAIGQEPDDDSGEGS